MVASAHEYTKNITENRLMNYLIEEQSQLDELEPLFRSVGEESGVVAVDTEFLREKTYNAKLCLVQLGIGEHQYCIDVLAIDDLSAIVDLFSDNRALKLFHAARQDLEVIYQTMACMPRPIFDTQLAAAFCGYDMQIGYGALVQEVTGVELPKSQSRTDWTRRPLSEEQVKYAGEDVAHLVELYEFTLNLLNTQDKYAWYEEEIVAYYDADKYVIDPQQAYKRLSGGNLSIKQQYLLRALANWREATAQERDIPRSWVIRDDKLYELVIERPKSLEEIQNLAAFGRKSSSYLAPQALEILRTEKTGQERLWRKVEPLSKPEKALCSQLMKNLGELAETYKVAQALLGTRKDIESLYRHRQSKRLLRGWRKDLVGTPLLEQIRGESLTARI